MTQYNYIKVDDRASAYAISVVNKEILVSESVYQTCERHLGDIRELDGYYWDYEEANKIIAFGELMSNPSTGQPLKLDPFQAFILGSLIGWKTNDGYKRFRTANVSLARKQGKSMLQAILAIYTLLAEENPAQNRQVHLGANSRSQSAILMKFVQMMVDSMISKSPALRRQLHSVQGRVEHKPSYSLVENLSNEASNMDGKNSLLFVYDEPHEASDTRLLDVISSGMVQQPNGQIVMISTAGFDVNKPYKKMYDYAKRIASGEEQDERYFSYIAYNTEDEIHKPELWVKSNPLIMNEEIGDIIFDNLKQDYQESINMNDTLGFYVKNLNMWVQSHEDSFLPAREWEACYSEPINKYGRAVYFGVDLSRRNDLTAVSSIYPQEEGAFYVDNHSFVATTGGLETKSQRDKIDYNMLVEKGYATASGLRSGFIDYEQVVDYMINEIKEYNLDVKAICYDRTMIEHLLPVWEAKTEGTPLLEIPFIEVAQNYMSLSQPIKEFQFKVYERKIRHNNNPNLNLAVNNAVLKYDNNSNVILDKMKAREKIDPLVALIIGFVEAHGHEYKDDVNKITEDYILSDEFGF